MNNPRITPKERNLIKGAIRRVFSRSELRRKVLGASLVAHSDSTRPRVTKWSMCNICKAPTAQYQAQVDHIIPIIKINSSLEHMTWDQLIDRIWCREDNLQVSCLQCHKVKTASEAKQRREHRNRNKKEGRNGKSK